MAAILLPGVRLVPERRVPAKPAAGRGRAGAAADSSSDEETGGFGRNVQTLERDIHYLAQKFPNEPRAVLKEALVDAIPPEAWLPSYPEVAAVEAQLADSIARREERAQRRTRAALGSTGGEGSGLSAGELWRATQNLAAQVGGGTFFSSEGQDARPPSRRGAGRSGQASRAGSSSEEEEDEDEDGSFRLSGSDVASSYEETDEEAEDEEGSEGDDSEEYSIDTSLVDEDSVDEEEDDDEEGEAGDNKGGELWGGGGGVKGGGGGACTPRRRGHPCRSRVAVATALPPGALFHTRAI